MEKEKSQHGITFLLLLLFLLLLVVGINTGEVSAVWEKAVSICLSCMGID